MGYSVPLMLHLERLAGTSVPCAALQAENLQANPQAHIDALVEAGVLRKTGHYNNVEGFAYRVVRPHKHEWRVEYANHAHSSDYAHIFCRGCKESRQVPNRLPIEAPE